MGQEEQILDELTSFAADQGFILPTPLTEPSGMNNSQSTASLNITYSESEETTSALWERLRSMIGRGLLASIDNIIPSQNESDFEVHLTKVLNRILVY